MSGKIIKTGQVAQDEIIEGVVKTVDAISRTLGPSGKAVVLAADFGAPEITRDGASVAKYIQLSDKAQDQGAQLVRKAASLTEDQAGDGPQPLYAKVLTPSGWTTMGQLKIGDKICGTNGTVQTVVGTFAKGQKEIFEVTFSNGQKVECCEDHLWTVLIEDELTTLPLKTIISRRSSGDIIKTPITFVDFDEPQEFDVSPCRMAGTLCDLDSEGEVKGIHIPVEYLFSSRKSRMELLVGFFNNIGGLNYHSKPVFKFKNESLYNSVLELIRSLGYSAKGYPANVSADDDNYCIVLEKKIFDNDDDTTSKYEEIVNIEKTGKFTEMMCIKVSNPDELYITNDYIVTHNTSTTSILIKELCLKGQKALKTGSNANEIKSGMIKTQKWVTDYIKKNSIEINKDLEKIKRVATISANNDPEVGNLIAKCMEEIGIDGVITADLSAGLDNIVDITTGLKIDRGWSSPQYVTSPETGKCIMEDAYVLIVGEKISSVSQIYELLKVVIKAGKPLLIICDDIDDNVNSSLVINTLQGAIRCCVIKGIDFGDGRKNTMMDIATVTGGSYICQECSKTLSQATEEDLGFVKKVIVSRDSTILFEGAGDKEKVDELAEVIRQRIKDGSTSKFDKFKFEKRLANLTGGIGVIKAGGATEVEKQNRKATIEDAILAAKSAIEEGCCAGSGYVYLKASIDIKKDSAFWKNLEGDEVEGAEIVVSSLPIIMKTVAENSGKSGDVIISEVKKNIKKENWGYNAKTKSFGSLVEAGVLDSAKVVRVALENSISTASMILLTDCLIYDEPNPQPDAKFTL